MVLEDSTTLQILSTRILFSFIYTCCFYHLKEGSLKFYQSLLPFLLVYYNFLDNEDGFLRKYIKYLYHGGRLSHH